MHLKKRIKIGEFLCSHFNIEGGRKYVTFSVYYAFYFKKGKNATETQRKICAVCGESAVTDQKWFLKFRARDFSYRTMLNGQVDQVKLIATESRH